MQVESSTSIVNQTKRPWKKYKSDSATRNASDSRPEETVHHIVEKKPNRRGKAGKLAGLLNTPVDILFEIFGHLRPLDILRLARMTKEFRRVLMHRSSLSVWKNARANIVGLPDCPPDMSEPQWANLAFDPHCHICLTTGIRSVEWRLRIRICAKCAEIYINEAWSKAELVPDPVPYCVCYERMISTRPGKRYDFAFLESEYTAMKSRYLAIQSREARDAFEDERKAAVKEIEKHAILCEEWVKRQTQDRSMEIQSIKDNRKRAIIERLTDLGWGEEINAIKYPDNFCDHILVKRPQPLTTRIWNSISDSMIEYMEEMKAKRLAREYPALVVLRNHIAIEALRTYKVSRLPWTEIMPEPVDFCDLPAVKAVIELPADTVVDESSFDEVIPDSIAGWGMSIHQQLVRRMVMQDEEEDEDEEYVYEDNDDDDDDDDDDDEEEEEDDEEEEELPEPNPSQDVVIDVLTAKLNLATTVFKCQLCIVPPNMYISEDSDNDSSNIFLHSCRTTKPLFYPKVLAHRCLTRTYNTRTTILSNDTRRKLLYDRQIRREWSCDFLSLDTKTGKLVEKIVTALGLDPNATSAGDMDQLDARIGCLTCSVPKDKNGLSKLQVFGWRSAVIHHASKHDISDDVDWHILNPIQINEARRMEQHIVNESASSPLSSMPSDLVVWLCVHCCDLPSEEPPSTLHLVKAHIRETHNIDEPEIDKDYYKHFAALELYNTDIPFQVSMMTIKLDKMKSDCTRK